MNLPAQAKARVLAAIASHPSPTRPGLRRRHALGWSVSIAWMLLVFGGLGGMRAVERPLDFVLTTAAGWAAVALVATWGCARGNSMLGRARSVLVLLVVATPPVLALWYACFLAGSDVARAGSPVSATVTCVVATIAMGLAPFVAFLLLRRGTDPTHPRATGAAVGTAGGAWAAVLMDLHCERGDLTHVACGHIVPALILAGVGVLVGASALGVHGDATSKKP